MSGPPTAGPPTAGAETPIPASIEWRGDGEGELVLLDQTRLPGERVLLHLRDAHGVSH